MVWFPCLRRDLKSGKVLVATAVMFAIGTIVVVPNLVLPLLYHPITLAYDPASGIVIQRRLSQFRLPLTWEAQVDHLNTGASPVCTGGGDQPYEAGDRTYTFELDVWVGEPGCAARLEPGEAYQIAATWRLEAAGVTLAEWKRRSEPFIPQKGTDK